MPPLELKRNMWFLEAPEAICLALESESPCSFVCVCVCVCVRALSHLVVPDSL